MTPKDLDIIGNNALVTVAGIKDIPAKVDTGADSSAIWATNLKITPDNQLEFTLLAPEHPLYTGKPIRVSEFSVKRVRSSNGEVSVRYQVPLSIDISGKRIRAKFTLADRSRNHFPILIGRRTLRGKFLVDVSQSALPRRPTFNNGHLNQELSRDPKAFHKKFME